MKFKITLVLLSALILSSCSPDNEDYTSSETANNIIVIGGATTTDLTNQSFQTELMAGQNIYAGIVNVDIKDGVVVVSYSSDTEWEITETHLYIGALNLLPTTGNGNPMIGQFPYADTHPVGTINVEIVGPTISEGDCVYIAAHAVVVNSDTGDDETAWGAGEPIGGTSWAMMFEYCY
ncbi:MAG: hypothetical protein KJO05_06065 [Bacteroidia bacterium]|nr:hypothetical protein [Bacteroidia bacterium]NNF32390.1 hypothetical protein [Flavobacteriaceae bacterium]MBT8275058.1 hypothetical protein [Bacteroidia bacterium]NNJ81725.1 hypothetical protein [Flavobacteriaceae bacterium]NNK55409.1 hypothetical protein [Flavobacteriaceae bacterium]